jgi:hypothetical protein
MADRAMAAKAERAKRQAREASYREFTKPYFLMQPSKRELRAMIGSLQGVMVRRGPSLAPKHRTRFHGDPLRRGSILTIDVYAFDTRLIRRHKCEDCNG